MNVEFIEKYSKLSDMKAGDTATSKDRESFFACGYHYDRLKKQNVLVIFDLNNLITLSPTVSNLLSASTHPITRSIIL